VAVNRRLLIMKVRNWKPAKPRRHRGRPCRTAIRWPGIFRTIYEPKDRADGLVSFIDALPLRSLGLVGILSRLDHLGFGGKTRIISHLPDAAERWIEAHANCEMLIYNVGGASIADRDNSQRIKALRAIAPDVPLVIFSESESREEIISALNVGAQGVLYAGMNSELALQAFSFILNGGSYFPSALRPRRPYPQRHPAIDCNPTPLASTAGSAQRI
jgi:DNA-binding NarL/FixJ family response regulator